MTFENILFPELAEFLQSVFKFNIKIISYFRLAQDMN